MTTDRDLSPDPGRHPAARTPGYRSTGARAPCQPPLLLPASVSELSGPVFGESLIGLQDHDLTRNFGTGAPLGNRIHIHGRVLDGDGKGVPGALVEVWQANAGGRYRAQGDKGIAPLDPGFGGCGRTLTDSSGCYRFVTIEPGPYPWANGGNDWRPRHIHFSLFGTAFAQRLISQMYFEGDPLIERCAIVQGLPRSAVGSLVARLDMERTVPMTAVAYAFDIVLRGRHSTALQTPQGAWP